jgi:hypothetical protein
MLNLNSTALAGPEEGPITFNYTEQMRQIGVCMSYIIHDAIGAA